MAVHMRNALFLYSKAVCYLQIRIHWLCESNYDSCHAWPLHSRMHMHSERDYLPEYILKYTYCRPFSIIRVERQAFHQSCDYNGFWKMWLPAHLCTLLYCILVAGNFEADRNPMTYTPSIWSSCHEIVCTCSWLTPFQMRFVTRSL